MAVCVATLLSGDEGNGYLIGGSTCWTILYPFMVMLAGSGNDCFGTAKEMVGGAWDLGSHRRAPTASLLSVVKVGPVPAVHRHRLKGGLGYYHPTDLLRPGPRGPRANTTGGGRSYWSGVHLTVWGAGGYFSLCFRKARRQRWLALSPFGHPSD